MSGWCFRNLFYVQAWFFSYMGCYKSTLWFYAQLPGTLKLRQQNQIKDYYHSKWLIFKHFLKGE